jgi:acyl dehydratase
MALDYEMLMSMAPRTARQTYTRRDTMLYALGLGIGLRATEDSSCLQYVFEEDLQALPTMATVLGHPGFWMAEPQLGIDWKRILHVEQSLEIIEPLPPEGAVYSETAVEAIFDKGEAKGALVYVKRRLFDAASKREMAMVRQGLFLRGNGGFGGTSGPSQPPHSPPQRPPDIVVRVITRPEQALIYRLSGDYNPLHVVPAIAKQAGFATPILHGLATYGIGGHVAVTELCAGHPSKLRRFDARFSNPVYPGETLGVAIWRDSDTQGTLEIRALERDTVVLKNGFVEFGTLT